MLKLKRGPVGWLVLGLLGFLLASCDSSSPATFTPPVSGTGALVPVSVSIEPNATSSPVAGSTTSQAVPLVTAGPVGSPTAAPQPLPTGSTSARDVVTKAVQGLSATSSLRYHLTQQGELKNGGSQTQFTADGAGEWQRPSLHQFLTYKEGGQTQQLEAFGDANRLYERVVSLVIWRKSVGTLGGPFPTADRLAQAGNFAQAGAYQLGQSQTTCYTWQVPVGRLSEQVEGLGSLSQTGLLAAFNTDKVQAQAAIWVDNNGQVLRYQLTTTLAVDQTNLDYIATYDYADFNTSVTVSPPGDLPKS